MSTRQLAAIMFTDMVGYTALMQQNEQLATQQRDRSKDIFEKSLEKHQGKLLQYYGDGALSVFSSALNAVKSAVEIQTLNRQEPKVEMRIGIHLGDVMFDDTGIYGDSVNVASRIESLAVSGSIFISEKLFDEIRNQGMDAKPLGYFELKNVKQPMQVYAVSTPGVFVPSRDEVKGKVKQTLNSIAVLPFASLSSDQENEFFCDGITEELLNVLSKVDGLQVTSRTSSFAFKGKTEDVREIAAKLNVQKILEGSVRKAGNKIRITAQLINAADGYHIWSETYDRSIEDIFAVQDDISREIANKFRLNLSEQEHAKELVKAPTENIEAYKQYLKGIYLWNTQLPENIQPSIEAFKEATHLDPQFAAPYSYLSFQYYFMGFAGMMPVQESLELCNNAALRAIEIDPDDPQAMLALGIAKMWYDFDWETSREFLQKSIDRNANSSLAYGMLGGYYLLMLQTKELEHCMEQLLRIDPLGAFSGGMAAEYNTMNGNFSKAIAIADEQLKFNPDNPYLMMIRSIAQGFQGDWNATIDFLEQGRKTIGDFPILLGYLGMAYSRVGDMEKAGAMVNALLELEKQPGVILDQVALVYGNMLRSDEFFERLNKSLHNRSLSAMYYYRTPYLPDEMSNDKRFGKIREEVGLPV